jgi:hypothetical protein
MKARYLSAVGAAMQDTDQTEAFDYGKGVLRLQLAGP